MYKDKTTIEIDKVIAILQAVKQLVQKEPGRLILSQLMAAKTMRVDSPHNDGNPVNGDDDGHTG